MEKLEALNLPNLIVVPFAHTGRGWVGTLLSGSSTAWISEDSVSMVYEALTSGVAVGLLDVKAIRPSRVSRGIEALVREGRVTRFSDWEPGTPLTRKAPLAEADRVAREILRRWFPERLPGADHA